MRVVVTGGTGCLGRPLLDKLIREGLDVKLLALTNDPATESLTKNIHVINGTINSPRVLESLTKDCDVVFHLAGMVHTVPGTREEEQKFHQVNVKGTKKLLVAARKNKVKRVVFYSTVGVYGKDADFHGDELSPCRPVSVYAKSKYQAEQLILVSSKNGGPEGVVLRFPVVYGPLDRGNVASLIKTIHKKCFFYFGDGKARRSMISSKNAAEAAFLAAFEPKAANQIFCVTDGQDYTIENLVESICLALDIKWRPFHIPISIANSIGKIGDFIENKICIPFPINSDKVRKLSRPLTFSCEKAERLLGYKLVETLQEGISREVEWLKRTQGWK